MTGAIFVSLKGNRDDNNLKTAQREVAATLKMAQSYALQGKSVSDSIGTPCGFGFRFTDETHYIIYSISADASNNCTNKNNSEGTRHYLSLSGSPTFETFDLKNGIKINESSFDNTDLYFTIPHGNAYDKNGSKYAGYTIFLKTPGNKQKTITINSSGSALEN